MGPESRQFKSGRVTLTVYPEIYFQFVSRLHNEHKDLVKAMQIAQVKLEDGSAIDFLNNVLGTDVAKETPMEIGFATLYDALGQRIVTPQSIKNFEEHAKNHFKDLTAFNYRDSSEHGKSLFEDSDDRKKQ